MKNKKAAIDEGLMTIYRTILATIIAFFILGISVFVYSYYLDVRDVEAAVLTKKVVNCLTPEGIADLSVLENYKDSKDFLQEYCKIQGIERFYVGVEFRQDSKTSPAGSEILILEQGENNLGWLVELSKDKEATQKIKKYVPGVLKPFYVPVVYNNGETGSMIIKVVVSSEFDN